MSLKDHFQEAGLDSYDSLHPERFSYGSTCTSLFLELNHDRFSFINFFVVYFLQENLEQCSQKNGLEEHEGLTVHY